MNKKNKLNKIKLIKKILVVLLITLILTYIIDKFIIKNYKIDGVSMNPTFEHESEVIVFKLPYIGNTPLFSRIFENMFPIPIKNSGDIIVFREPTENKIIIKRVIAAPGDNIQMDNLRSYNIFLNDKLINKELIITLNNSNISIFKEINGDNVYTVQYENKYKNKFLANNHNNYNKENNIYIPKKGDILILDKLGTNSIKRVTINGKIMNKNWMGMGCLDKINEETKINLFNFDGDRYIYNIKNNYYFVIGDNRERSKDSRYWGILSDSLIIGHPLFKIFPSFSRIR